MDGWVDIYTDEEKQEEIIPSKHTDRRQICRWMDKLTVYSWLVRVILLGDNYLYSKT